MYIKETWEETFTSGSNCNTAKTSHFQTNEQEHWCHPATCVWTIPDSNTKGFHPHSWPAGAICKKWPTGGIIPILWGKNNFFGARFWRGRTVKWCVWSVPIHAERGVTAQLLSGDIIWRQNTRRSAAVSIREVIAGRPAVLDKTLPLSFQLPICCRLYRNSSHHH